MPALYTNTDQIHTEETQDTGGYWRWATIQRLISDGLTDDDLHKEVPTATTIEYWGKFDWNTDEDGEPDIQDTQIITTNNNDVCLRICKNPFYDQEIPYLQARYNELQNESYPSGLFEPLASLQYYLNDDTETKLF